MHFTTGNAFSSCSCWRKSSCSGEGGEVAAQKSCQSSLACPCRGSISVPGGWGCSRDCSSGAAARGAFWAGRFQDLGSAAGTQEQPFISTKLTKGAGFRKVQVQGTPNTHHRTFEALQPPQSRKTGTQGESTLDIVSKSTGASAQALPG